MMINQVRVYPIEDSHFYDSIGGFTMIPFKNGQLLRSRHYWIENRKYFLSDDFLSLTSRHSTFQPLESVSQEQIYQIQDHTYPFGSIGTVLKLREEGEAGHLIVLNFANALHPGGGYLWGAKAQEEDLCRCSLLYHALKTQPGYYLKNLIRYSSYGPDECLFSREVPVFRNESYELIPPTQASFLTAVAVNRTLLKWSTFNLYSRKRVETCLEERMKHILSLALSQNPDVLVLGAWGCGVFGNDRAFVLSRFESLIQTYVPLDQVRVVFAMPELNNHP